MDKNIVVENHPIKLLNNDKIKIHGRHSEYEGCIGFDWVGSGISFNFKGTGFILSLKYKGVTVNYVKVIIDGKHRQRFAIANGNEKIIIEGLKDSYHSVKVLKVTESIEKLGFDEISLLGKEACLENPPLDNPRRLEFIGDSITCGYGVIGPVFQPSYHTYQQDNTYSYAYLTSERLGAEGRYISVSGKGIYCNCEGSLEDVKAVQFYEYLTREGGVCNDGYEPEVLVINIGTNDGFAGAKAENFEIAAKEMLTKARARYKNAHIIWLYGMMNNFYKDIIRKTINQMNKTDGKLYFLYVDAATLERDEIGANGHPSVNASIRVSSILARKIRSITGWKGNKTE